MVPCLLLESASIPHLLRIWIKFLSLLLLGANGVALDVHLTP